MARFSQGLLTGLGQPAMLQDFRLMGAALGGVPAAYRQKKQKEADAEMLNSIKDPAAKLEAMAKIKARQGDLQAAQAMMVRAEQIRAEQTRAERDKARFGWEQEGQRRESDRFGREKATWERESEDRRVEALGVIDDLVALSKDPSLSARDKRVASSMLMTAAKRGDAAVAMKERVDELRAKYDLPAKGAETINLYNPETGEYQTVLDTDRTSLSRLLGEGYVRTGDIDPEDTGMYGAGEPGQFEIGGVTIPEVLVGQDIIANAVGPIDAMAAAAEGVIGLDESVQGEVQRASKVFLADLRKDLEAAVANSPRFAQMEREQIERLGLTNVEGGPMTSESALRTRLEVMKASLEDDYKRSMAAISDPNTTNTVKGNEQTSAQMVAAALSRIDAILSSHSAPQGGGDIPQDIQEIIKRRGASPRMGGGN